MAVDLSVDAGVQDPTAVLLSWPPDPGVVSHQILAYIIMRREGGVLLVVPGGGCIDEDSLQIASTVPSGAEEAVIGPYKLFQVPMLVSNADGGGEMTVSTELAEVLVVDMNFLGAMSLVEAFPEELEDYDLINLFADLDPQAHPDFDILMTAVRSWLADELQGGSAYATAEEDTVASPARRTRARPSTPGVSTKPEPKAAGGAKRGAKKPTVASIAQQMDAVLQALPVITNQLADLTQRQGDLEKKQTKGSSSTAGMFHGLGSSKASAPVSSLMTAHAPPNLGSLAASLGAPPTSKARSTPLPDPDLDGQPWVPGEIAGPARVDLEEEAEMGSPMQRAILEQSKALSALIAHFHSVGNDPFTDLASSTPSTGVKGAMAREKFQRELADGTGAFFLKVCHQIQRRVAPTARSFSDRSRVPDVSLLGYLERYGGYGQNRELGMVQWSLAHAFDAAVKEEWGLVKDHLAMTSVMVEQAALDNNKWQLAWLLRLLDDPPQNLWLNRGQTAVGAKRPFAPLCTQGWTTTALAYLKEAEVLQGKRQDLLGGKHQANDEGQPDPKPSPTNNSRRLNLGRQTRLESRRGST